MSGGKSYLLLTVCVVVSLGRLGQRKREADLLPVLTASMHSVRVLTASVRVL
mgnify:CR=1 FL=1